MKAILQKIYLEWVNDWLTVSRMAELHEQAVTELKK